MFRSRQGWAAALPLCLAALCLPDDAGAQVIDQYLDQNIPGYGPLPGVTVGSRLHPEYEPGGIHLGAFTLSPSLDESFGYDSNVTGTPSPAGSAVIETNPKIALSYDQNLTQAAAQVTLDDYEYPDLASQSYHDWTAALGVTHQFGEDSGYIGASHLDLYQTPRDLDVPQLTQPIGYRVNNIRVGYTWNFSRLSLQPGVDLSWFSFDNGSVLGTPYIQTYRDRFVVSPSLTASYEFATRRRIVVVVRDSSAAFANPIAGIPRQDFNDFSVLVGLAYEASGALSFRLLAGYEQRDFRSGAYKTISAPIVEGSVTWTPTSLTTITGTAARYIEDSAAEATTGYTETALKVNVDHELYRNVILNANGAVYLDNYQGGGNQTYYTVGAGGTYKLNRNLGLALSYTYANRTGNGGSVLFPGLGGIFGANYDEHVVVLQLKVGF